MNARTEAAPDDLAVRSEDPGPPRDRGARLRPRSTLPLPHVRLMPTAIILMGLVLGLKSVELGRDLGWLGPRPSVPTQVVSAAQAQAVPRDAPQEDEERPELVPPPPPRATEAERTLLEALRARRLQIEEREKSAADREAVLQAAEKRLAARVDELSQLQNRLEALEKARKEREEAGWAGLVRIYEQMKPKDAARIFDEMEMTVLVEVLDRMKERPASAVLASMAPEKARLLTGELAQRRARPAQGRG